MTAIIFTIFFVLLFTFINIGYVVYALLFSKPKNKHSDTYISADSVYTNPDDVEFWRSIIEATEEEAIRNTSR